MEVAKISWVNQTKFIFMIKTQVMILPPPCRPTLFWVLAFANEHESQSTAKFDVNVYSFAGFWS